MGALAKSWAIWIVPLQPAQHVDDGALVKGVIGVDRSSGKLVMVKL